MEIGGTATNGVSFPGDLGKVVLLKKDRQFFPLYRRTLQKVRHDSQKNRNNFV